MPTLTLDPLDPLQTTLDTLQFLRHHRARFVNDLCTVGFNCLGGAIDRLEARVAAAVQPPADWKPDTFDDVPL